MTSAAVIVVLMVTLCIYLLYTGGSSNTEPLWLFILPTLIYYISGLRCGTITLSLLFLFVLYLLFIPGNPLLVISYPAGFTYRFVGSFYSVCVLAFAYEFTWKECQKELLPLSEKMDVFSR